MTKGMREGGREGGRHVRVFFGGGQRLSLLASFFPRFLDYNIAIHSQSESGKEEDVQERERV
jgi:hypothetical protein